MMTVSLTVTSCLCLFFFFCYPRCSHSSMCISHFAMSFERMLTQLRTTAIYIPGGGSSDDEIYPSDSASVINIPPRSRQSTSRRPAKPSSRGSRNGEAADLSRGVGRMPIDPDREPYDKPLYKDPWDARNPSPVRQPQDARRMSVDPDSQRRRRPERDDYDAVPSSQGPRPRREKTSTRRPMPAAGVDEGRGAPSSSRPYSYGAGHSGSSGLGQGGYPAGARGDVPRPPPSAHRRKASRPENVGTDRTPRSHGAAREPGFVIYLKWNGEFGSLYVNERDLASYTVAHLRVLSQGIFPKLKDIYSYAFVFEDKVILDPANLPSLGVTENSVIKLVPLKNVYAETLRTGRPHLSSRPVPGPPPATKLITDGRGKGRGAAPLSSNSDSE